jgi:NAD(P)-dependent dehydrogenase (short-subunit alcohol dehydrogenase family)
MRKGGAAIAVAADVAHENEVISFFVQTVAAFGWVDILIGIPGRQRHHSGFASQC